MTKAKSSAKAPDKVMDVSKPGKTAATATSKPVLITNRPVMKDPMVNQPEDGEQAPAVASAPLLTPAKKVIIKPIHDDVVPEGEASKDDEPKTDSKTEDKKEKPELPESKKERTIAELAAAGDAGEVVKVTTKKDADKDEVKPIVDEKPAEKAESAKDDPQVDPGKAAEADEAAQKAADEHNAEIQKLVASQKYFLPINHQEKRRTRRFVLLGVLLIIALAVAWGDVALDAGLVTVHQNLPHTHFFASKK